jgi:hypothetical protein
MGNLTWACLGVCATTVCGLAGAQAAGTPAPAHVAPGASAAFPSAPLPPPPPPPAAPPPATYPAPYPAAPYPAAPYPPLPYGYPPPLPYGYYYPPPMPPPLPKPRFPDDAAVTTSPFLDAIVVGESWQNRVSQPLNVGAEAGAYLGGRLRLVARAAVPASDQTDQPGIDSSFDSAGYQRRASDTPVLFYGASAGVVVYNTQDFALAPGIAFARTDVSDFGTMVAASVPFDWVMASGLRIGLELELGQAFGGSYRYQCQDSTGSSCGGPPQITRDRPSGTAFLMQFQIGFGFNHPDPLPPSAPLPR